MDDYCSNSLICKDGNCLGCKNGHQFCNDICFPNCENCTIPSDFEGITFIVFVIIFLLLMLILIVFYFIFGMGRKSFS